MADDEPKFHLNNPSTLHPISSPHTYLFESLSHLLSTTPPSNPWLGTFSNGACRGVFAGPTSIAYLFLHLSHSHPSLSVAGKTPAEWCASYLACGQSDIPVDTAKDCGVLNEGLSYRAVLAASRGPASSAAVDELLSAVSAIVTPPQFNEWFQGRAGTLVLLRIVRAFVPSRAADIDTAMQPLIAHIMTHGTPNWTHFGKHLLGAGHGDVGIITQLVLSSPKTAPKLEKKLDALLDRQTERGNWFTSTANDRDLVQWCHGAPGFVLCLRAVRPYFPALQNRIDVAMQKAEALTWAEGILVKEPNLCHGVHGNAIALDDKRKSLFLSVATPEKMRTGLDTGKWVRGNDAAGLLWGEAGRAWVWATMDGGNQYFPAFTDV